MKKHLFSKIILSGMLLFFVAPQTSLAQFKPEDVKKEAVNNGNMSPDDDLGQTLIRFLKYAMYLIAFVAVAAFVVSGFMFIFSAGENGGKKARDILMFAVIGLVVALLGWVILNSVATMLGIKSKKTTINNYRDIEHGKFKIT